MNCLGQSTANLYVPSPKAYIVNGLLLIFSSRHYHAVKFPFYFFWCSSPPIFSLCTFCKLTRHFTISWIFNGWSGASLFSTITLNFVCTVFAFFLFCDVPQIFLHFFLQLCVPSFFSSCFLSSRFNFLPSVFFLNEFFQVVAPSSVIHKFTLSPFWLTSINSENRLFACNCPLGRKFRSILVVYNWLKTS